MCRIYGSFNACTSEHELRTVAALMRHGGPDAQSCTRRSDWALGNNRLSVMDPEGGDQPYRLDGITVVFNGEIYNHNELRAGLERRGFAFADRCDGSILPALYLVHGERFAEQLDGMFAIAVMDRRGEPRMVLATDESGMKPLYYAWDQPTGRLRFASELPALLGFTGVPVREDELGLDAYLSAKTPFGEQTMFEGIRVLPPAATAVVTRDGFQLTTRPMGHAAQYGPVGTGRPLAQVGAELRELLRTEVHRLLLADAPVAAITSGGLDSSLVTALAAEVKPDLHTFNIAYTGDWPWDERHFAAEVADAVGTVHHQVEIDPATFPDLLSDVVWHLGQPNADPIALSTFSLFRAVRDAGFKVALTGDAADELFGGYARMQQAEAAPGGLRWVSAYLDHLSAIPQALRKQLYTPDFAAAVRIQGSALPTGLADTLCNAAGTRLRRICAAEQQYRLPAYHLRRVDHLSMAGSVEARLPFCQPSVVRYAASLADEHRISPEGVKRALYAAAEGLVPQSVLNRPKQPFTLPVTAMLSPGQALWETARDLLSDSVLRADGRLRPDAVAQLFVQQEQQPNDQAALAIWALMTHQIWRRQFFGASRRQASLVEVG